MKRTKRAVGYCVAVDCDDYLKGVFLLNHGDTYYCHKCKVLGFVQAEEVVDLGGNFDEVYKTVRVHFNFNACTRTYTEIAVVDIPELKFGGIYEMYSPLIRTEKRALAVAEINLCALNSGLKDNESTLSPRGLTVDLGSPDWKVQMDHVQSVLEERERRVAYALDRQNCR